MRTAKASTSPHPENLVRQSYRMHIKAEGLLDQSVTHQAATRLQGEHVLLVRVIYQAICDAMVRRPNPAPGCHLSINMKTLRMKWLLERTRARTWLLDETVDPDGQTPFSLQWCASQLGVQASTVRRRARRTFGLLDDPSVKPYTFDGGYAGCLA